jgi:hypothetical protein
LLPLLAVVVDAAGCDVQEVDGRVAPAVADRRAHRLNFRAVVGLVGLRLEDRLFAVSFLMAEDADDPDDALLFFGPLRAMTQRESVPLKDRLDRLREHAVDIRTVQLLGGWRSLDQMAEYLGMDLSAGTQRERNSPNSMDKSGRSGRSLEQTPSTKRRNSLSKTAETSGK